MITDLRPTKTVDSVLTPCDGRSAVFDSTDTEMHKVAKAICDTCPFFVACDRLRVATERELTASFMQGTWAGKHYHRKHRVRRATTSSTRARGRDVECVACGVDCINAGRELCGRCYTLHLRAGTLEQFPRNTTSDSAA